MEWTPILKITLILSVLFFGMVLGFLMVTMKSLGGIGHSLERLEALISKEVVATHRRKLLQLKRESQRQATEIDRTRRQHALLNVPLMSNRRDKPPTKEEKP